MKPIIIALLLGAPLVSVVAQDVRTPAQADAQTIQKTPAEQAAHKELNAAAHSYREANFVEAQQHSEKALALDPANKTAAAFVARTIHAQYQPGVHSEANVAKAREAIDAYKRILVQEPLNDESYKAIAYLYQALKEEELLREWIYLRALDSNVSEDKRSEAYIVLASKAWDCSFKITELPSHKSTAISESAVRVQYIKPRDPLDFEKARQCASNGLEFAEAAITLIPANQDAWAYKSNLLLEMTKLAEMDENLQLKADYQRQLEAARFKSQELSVVDTNGRPRKP